jgi:putative heme-binding domain-containing protein
MRRGLRTRQKELLLVGIILLGGAYFLFQRNFEGWRRAAQMPSPRSSLAAFSVKVLPGFKLEKLYSAAESQGSWISMVFDPQGRIIVSPQAQGPLLRLTLGRRSVTKIERLPDSVGSASGLLYASNSLYLDCVGPKGLGIYRMPVRSDDQFGAPELVLPLNMWDGEHGCHGIQFGPDGKLYVVCGDHTKAPSDPVPSSPFRNEAEDHLLPEEFDLTGWDLSVQVPNGFVLRMDTNGQNCELFAGGMRNVYRIGFNPDGELFGIDNDHDPDLGLPWYRPCRIYHIVAGGEYGHRPGTAKFPEYYEDALPPVRNVGLGAPSGLKFAPTNCSFPPFYRNACFAADWTYGRLFAIHFVPHGATYQATMETVLRGRPLNVTAMDFGPDGALYFVVGGRFAASGLYRLSWVGGDVREPESRLNSQPLIQVAARSRSIRHQLEALNVQPDPRQLDFAWSNLSNEDRSIRFAARRALEALPVVDWESRALSETNIYGGLTALLALARCGEKSTQAALFAALENFPLNRVKLEQTLIKLRTIEVSLIRQGNPSAPLRNRLLDELSPFYPSADDLINHELCQILLYLDGPDAISKTVALMKRATTTEEQVYYVKHLRNFSRGWSAEDRKTFESFLVGDRAAYTPRPEVIQYFHDVGSDYHAGKNLDLYLNSFEETLATALGGTTGEIYRKHRPKQRPEVFASPTPSRTFVKAWKMEDLLPDIGRLSEPQHLPKGRFVYFRASCALCHRFGGEGGPFGPDLSSIGSRASAREILESILEPSKIIPQEYQNTVVVLKSGDVLTGRVIEEDARRVLMITEPINLTRIYIQKSEIESRRISRLSPMPEGLLNSLSEEEIWDLVARLQAGPGPPSNTPIQRNSAGY